MRKSAQNWFRETSCRTKRTWGGTGALTFWNQLKIIPIFWKVSLLVTRHGCLSTTQKPPARAWNGTLKALQGKKIARMRKSKIKSMLLWSFDSQGIVHKELCLHAKGLINTFTKRVLKDYTKAGVFNLLSSRANLHISYNPAGRSHCRLQNHHGYNKHHHRGMGGSPGDVGEVPVM